VVINDFDTTGTRVCPDEAHAPLGVDADAVLSSPVAPERLKAVAGRTAQELKGLRRVEHLQLAFGNGLDAAELPRATAFEKGTRLTAVEGLDHSVKRIT